MRPPTLNAVSQGKHGQYNAVDYRAKTQNGEWRKEIYAPEDMKIVFYGNNGDAGRQLQAWSLDGLRRHGFAHTASANVVVGQVVRKGDVIGRMGYTGRVIPVGVNGTHLHHTIRLKNGTYVYPPSLITEPFGGPVSKHPFAYLVGKTIKLQSKTGSWSVYKGDKKIGELGNTAYIVRGVSSRSNRVLINSAKYGSNIELPLASAAGKVYDGEWRII